MTTVNQLAPEVGVAAACRALALPRSSLYRWQQPGPQRSPGTPTLGLTQPPTGSHPRALTQPEKQAVLLTLNSERFCDQPPTQVYATLIDEGVYLCSVRSMYRYLEKDDLVRERRNQLRHPEHPKPELLATAPNQVWSWDITKLKGPIKWTSFHLYVVLDLFSRYVVGWMVATKECAHLAKRLIEEGCQKQNVGKNQLIVHSDRGPSMTSKSMALLLADLAVIRSLSRPRVSNDNPFSESQFKTLKYRPEFPDRFGSLEDARTFCRRLFDWYNTEHHHSSLGFLTPHAVHYRLADSITDRRQTVLSAAYAAHPERFVRGRPVPPTPARAVWINPPKEVPTQ